jgi:putative copper resistance protein D
MIDGAWLVLRALALVLVLQAVGAALFCASFGGARLSGEQALRRTAWRMSAIALVVLAAQVLCEPMHLAADVSGLTDPALLGMLVGSGAGRALAVRIAGVACVAVATRLAPARSRLVTGAGVLLTALSFPLTGHTAIAPHRGWLALLLFTHVLLVMFWFGALWPLRQVLELETPACAGRTVTAFSTVAVRLVPLLALAGAAIAVLLVPDVAVLGRPWGLLLLGKVTLFTALMGLASLNRLRLTPALAGGEARAATRLTRTIAVEYGLICVTLAVTAVMTGNFSPGGQ